MKENTTNSLKIDSWCWLAIAIGLSIYFFIEAIQSSSFFLSLVGAGFLVLGIVWFKYPTPFTTPLTALFRDKESDMDSKYAVIGFIGILLVVLGTFIHLIIKYL